MTCGNPECKSEPKPGNRYCDRKCLVRSMEIRRNERRRGQRRRQVVDTCQRIACGKPLPKGKSRYCDNECWYACHGSAYPEPHRCRGPGCGQSVTGKLAWCSPECKKARPLGGKTERQDRPDPAEPCPQCGAAGALRREGRSLYCAQRCGYYLTPGQRGQAA